MILRILGALTVLFATPVFGQKTIDFARDIRPILEKRCYGCHGVDRQKGDLRLDDKSSVFGHTPKLLVPGKAAESHLYKLITLAEDDEDLMPAKGGPLSGEQIASIRQWIDDGAAWPDDGPKVVVRAAETIELPELTEAEAAAEARALEALQKKGVLAQRVANNTRAVYVNFSLLGTKIQDADVALLQGLEPTLVWLNLSRTGISNAGLLEIKEHRRLRQLNLSNTAIADEGLDHLAQLQDLESLNLYGTQVTDAGLKALADLTKLKKLYLWLTKVTDEAASKLNAKKPDLAIDLGRYADTIKDVASNLPINAVCPLTDQPVDNERVVTFEGQKIGLCCAKCQAAFEKEPEKYIGKVKEFKRKAPKKPAQEAPSAGPPLNTTCPLTGRPVVAKFTAVHDEKVIGFCCGRCLSLFTKDPKKYAAEVDEVLKAKK